MTYADDVSKERIVSEYQIDKYMCEEHNVNETPAEESEKVMEEESEQVKGEETANEVEKPVDEKPVEVPIEVEKSETKPEEETSVEEKPVSDEQKEEEAKRAVACLAKVTKSTTKNLSRVGVVRASEAECSSFAISSWQNWKRAAKRVSTSSCVSLARRAASCAFRIRTDPFHTTLRRGIVDPAMGSMCMSCVTVVLRSEEGE